MMLSRVAFLLGPLCIVSEQTCSWDALTPTTFVFMLLQTDLVVMVLWSQGAQRELQPACFLAP